MMQSNGQAAHLYTDAMCMRCCSADEAKLRLKEVILTLSGRPLNEAVISDGVNVVVSVQDAIAHIKNKLERLE